MAIKYLAGDRLIGTAAERAALTTSAYPSPTYSNTFTSTTDFSTTSTSHANVNSTVAGALYHDVERASTNKACQWALPAALSNTVWTLRFQSTMTDVGTSGQTNRVFIGMSNLQYSAGSSSSHEFIGVATKANTSQKIWYPLSTKANNLDVGDNDSATYALSETTIYVEIRRKSATSFYVSWTTNSDYTTGATTNIGVVGEDGGSGTVEDLQYFLVSNVEVAFSGGLTATKGNIPLVEIWNGVDGVNLVYTYPSLPNGAIFEESDTGKIYMFDGTDTWNEVT